MLTPLKAAWLYLATLNADLPWLCVWASIFLIVYAVRKLAPSAWLAFELHSPVHFADPAPLYAALHKAYQAIPSVLLGIGMSWLATGDWKKAAIGALVGLVPPLTHEFASWAPFLSYKGELGKIKPKSGPKGPPSGGATVDPEPTGVNYERPDSEPPAAALSLYQFLTLQLRQCGLVLIAAACLALVSCSPAGWAAQRDASNAVAEAANKTIEPALLAAYRATGLVVVRAQPTEELGQVALNLHIERWKPVWAAWETFKEAHEAWQKQIEAEGNPVPAALAARDSYCQLQKAAAEWAVSLPALPLGACR
jgi:hypothetical protein